MAQENISIELPKSKQIAVIKSFIPHKVAREVQDMIIGDKEVDASTGTVSAEVVLVGRNLIKMQEILAYGLTIQIGEHYAIGGQIQSIIDDLDEEDFSAISTKVLEVYKNYSEGVAPKK